jgi:hypothetical protein
MVFDEVYIELAQGEKEMEIENIFGFDKFST